jgi:hypothetical protein
MPPSYVKAYVRRQKNDAADAAAILRSGHSAFDAIRADTVDRQSSRSYAPQGT